MGKDNLDLSMLGVEDGDVKVDGRKGGTREGGKQGAYRRVNELINTHISRAEEDGNDDVVNALTSLQADVQRTKETSGVVQGALKHYIGMKEDGSLESFDSVGTPTLTEHPDFVRAFGPYRKSTGLAFRLEHGIPVEEQSARLVFFRAA